MDCEYAKYGCTAKLANDEHLQLHLQTQAHQHMVGFYEKEFEKSKHLAATPQSLLEQVEKSKGEVIDKQEGKLQLPQGMMFSLLSHNINDFP
jgi:hypothetical protein